ncbi:MAG: class I SAM-dependent methyltransferase [Phenylobacterium sp.]|uniref:class I SAM-dependent methyltransferase n=1 Tax=Phenylobacterium sp. TaxID=1871053 RepID=UPI00271E3962|nr:class I SAM-dependent methyltransferase [Phenylobacterium sp.]MDO8409256.1 class I SAM-dependent methyltransferase [Phenylobacterium sp.]
MSAAPFLECPGWCPVCEQDVVFASPDAWLRDGLKCSACGSIPRERALMRVLAELAPDWRRLALHESSGCSISSNRLREQCPGYVATQYDPATPWGHKHPNGYRSEDLEAQTFADETFDIVVTQDVFEHLFAPDRAIAEIGRTLKPGGFHICTVPIVRKAEGSVRRARRRPDGSVEHLAEPEYHGNPMDPDGSLVTVDWGYDIADYLDQASGLSTTIHTIDDLSQGIRAAYIEVLVSRKTLPSAVDLDGASDRRPRRRKPFAALARRLLG